MNTIFLTEIDEDERFTADDAELRTELRQRGLIRQLLSTGLDFALQSAAEGILTPDDEEGNEAIELYGTLQRDLAGMLKPEFLAMLTEEYADVYRGAAGERLRNLLGWEHTGDSGGREECA